MEAAGEFLPAGFGEGANPGAEGLGLKDAQGHHLPATGAATSLAGNGAAGFAQLIGNATNERVFERLQDGQDFGEVALPGGNDRSGGEFPFTDAHHELDRDSFLLLLINRLRIVANSRPEGSRNGCCRFPNLRAYSDFLRDKAELDGGGS
jgi:hypothetical protein